MRTTKFLLCIFVLVTLVCGCGKKGPSETRESVVKVDETGREVFDMSVVESVGNHSYIPINFMGKAGAVKNASYIMEILVAFEKAHPNLEITNWRIEGNPSHIHLTDYFIFGIWVDHRPRQS